jgi:hypothetical protein
MPKLLAATKILPLDLFLAKNEELKSRGFDVVVPAFSHYGELTRLAREAIGDEDISVSAPVAVLSSALGKGKPLEDEAIYPLRALGYRIVFLPGDAAEESTKALVRAAVGLGVYDFIYDPHSGSDVVYRILKPATVADVDSPLLMERESPFKEERQSVHENDEVDSSLKSSFARSQLQQFTEKANQISTEKFRSILHRITSTSALKLPKLRRSSAMGEIITLLWSPVPAGKTFLSVNLSAVAVQHGFTVALVDYATDCGPWLGLKDEDGLEKASNGCDNPWVYGHNPEILENLGVFTTTSKSPGKLNIEFVKDLGADLVIVNSNILLPASNIIVVADMDMSHVRKISEFLEEMDNFPSAEKWLVVNRAVKGMPIKQVEEALGMRADAVIPDMAKEVFESIAAGVPASMFCEEIAAPLRSLLGVEGG